MSTQTVRFFDRDLTVTFDIDPDQGLTTKSALKRNKRATTCTVVDKNGKKLAKGITLCGPSDVFNEEQGKLIAINRALDRLGRDILRAEKYKITKDLIKL